MTLLSFIVKCDYASKIKTTLRMQPSDWLQHIMFDENQNMTKVSASHFVLKLKLAAPEDIFYVWNSVVDYVSVTP